MSEKLEFLSNDYVLVDGGNTSFNIST
jgi:hypothetical protein